MPDSINRRNFVLSAAALAGASWLDVPELLGRNQTTDEVYGGFRMGIQSFSLREFDVEETLRHVHDLGLNYIEFYGGHFEPTHDKGEITIVDRSLAESNVRIQAHGVNAFNADHERNKHLFWFARMAGIKTITADPAPEAFDSLDELVRQFDIRVAIHNHGPGHRYDAPSDVLDAIEGRDERIGACADLGHFIRSGVDPIDATYQLGNRLYGVHLKDYDSAGVEATETIIGDGVLDVQEFFDALNEVDFPADGALSLEYEQNPDDPIEDIREGLQRAARAAQLAAA